MIFITPLLCCFITASLISCFHRDDSLLTEFDADSMDKSSSGKDQDISCEYIAKEPSESLFCCTTEDSDLQQDSVEKLALLREKRARTSDLTMPVSLKNEDIAQNVASGTAIWDLTSNNTQNTNITDSEMNKTNIEHSPSNLTSNATKSIIQKPKTHKNHSNTTDSATNATVSFTNLSNSSSNSTDENSNTTSISNTTSKLNFTFEDSTNITAYDDFKCHNETISLHNMTSNTTFDTNDDIPNEYCVDGFAASEDHSKTPTEISSQNNHDTKNTTKNRNDILSGDVPSNNPILCYLFSLSLLIAFIVS